MPLTASAYIVAFAAMLFAAASALSWIVVVGYLDGPAAPSPGAAPSSSRVA
jgi:hypothetical protein